MLQDSPWQFNHALKPLSPLTDTVFNWAHVYQYPSDCLRINYLVINYAEVDSTSGASFSARHFDRGLPRPNLNQQVPYKIYNLDGNRVVAANEAELRIDYRVRVTDPNLFSGNFILALSHLLASDLAVSIIGVEKGLQMRSAELKVYQSYVDSGIVNELNEQFTERPDSDFINVR